MTIRPFAPRQAMLFLGWTLFFMLCAGAGLYFFDRAEEQRRYEPAKAAAPEAIVASENAAPAVAASTAATTAPVFAAESLSTPLPTPMDGASPLLTPVAEAAPAPLETEPPAASSSLPTEEHTPASAEQPAASLTEAEMKTACDPAWKPLVARLVADGFDEQSMNTLFSRLGPTAYSPAFMAAKILELHGVGGIGIKHAGAVQTELPEGYTQPLSDVTMGSCKAFMAQYAELFDDVQKKHGVSANIIVAILLVETCLGTDLGSDSALRALASMAATTTPAMLGSEGNSAQVRRMAPATLKSTLANKSAWAYNEVKALIQYGEKNDSDVSKIPGSMYGAVGLCQFMPSNIELYGVDGDNDGKIDLFTVPDAIYSVANYLEANGWRGAGTPERKFQVIRTYNMDNYYAAKVLAVATQIDRALKGKVADASNPLGVGPAAPAMLDPSLRRRGRVPAMTRVKSLGDYQELLQ